MEIYSKPLEELQDKLIKKHGFTQESHKLDIFGICPRCQGRKEAKK